jgi:glycosyltransferase involved in cell wall biosynthesis
MPAKRRRKSLDVLIHCPGSHGMIADQVHQQAMALHNLGISVLVICGHNYLRTRNAEYPVATCMLEGATTHNQTALSRKLGKALQIVRNQLRFAWEVFRKKPALVLSSSHVEAQAPVWIWPHMLLVLLRRTIYATNLHFPVRQHQIGPKWWTALAAQLAFKPFRIAVAHKRLADKKSLPRHVQMVEVPLGPEKIAQVELDPKAIRKTWQVPRGRKVFLAFGDIRNHKNLDVAIRALEHNPKAHLVIHGSIKSHKDRPLKYYKMLAEDLGLSKRVTILDSFVPDEHKLSHYKAADFILLNYSGTYHSQTNGLAHAVEARRHSLVSSGTSPMRDFVEHFGLGVFVEPDSPEALANGMATLIHGKMPDTDWEGFEEHTTWETNVTRVLEAAANEVHGRPTPVRQFDGLEEEALPIPRLLDAKDFLPEKKTPARTTRKTTTRRTTRKKDDTPADSPVNGHHDPLQQELPMFQTRGSKVNGTRRRTTRRTTAKPQAHAEAA